MEEKQTDRVRAKVKQLGKMNVFYQQETKRITVDFKRQRTGDSLAVQVWKVTLNLRELLISLFAGCLGRILPPQQPACPV